MSKTQEMLFESKYPELLHNFGLDNIHETRRLVDYFARFGRPAIKGFDLGIATLLLLNNDISPTLTADELKRPFIFDQAAHQNMIDAYRLALVKGADAYNVRTIETSFMRSSVGGAALWAYHETNGNILAARTLTGLQCEKLDIFIPFTTDTDTYIAAMVTTEQRLEVIEASLLAQV